MADSCSLCFEDIGSTEIIKCSGICGGLFHYSCLSKENKNYKKAVIEMLNKIDNLQWYCENCIPHSLNTVLSKFTVGARYFDEIKSLLNSFISQTNPQTHSNSNSNSSSNSNQNQNEILLDPSTQHFNSMQHVNSMQHFNPTQNCNATQHATSSSSNENTTNDITAHTNSNSIGVSNDNSTDSTIGLLDASMDSVSS